MGGDPSYDPLRVNTTWPYRLGSLGSPLLLLWVSWLGFSRGSGIPPVAAIIGLSGLAFLAVGLLDSPLWVRFTDDGVVRRCALRRVLHPWDEVIALVRPRRQRGLVSRMMGPGGEVPGLAIRRTSSRVLLYTHRERPDQADVIERLLARVAPGLDMPD